MIIIHSAKGSTWKKHKYVKVVDGKYIYPENYKNGYTVKGPTDEEASKEGMIKVDDLALQAITGEFGVGNALKQNLGEVSKDVLAAMNYWRKKGAKIKVSGSTSSSKSKTSASSSSKSSEDKEKEQTSKTKSSSKKKKNKNKTKEENTKTTNNTSTGTTEGVPIRRSGSRVVIGRQNPTPQKTPTPQPQQQTESVRENPVQTYINNAISKIAERNASIDYLKKRGFTLRY